MPRPIGRRAEIHATFIRHVAERGYEGTNLGDIATELDMSKGTIVHHFGTKAQMLRELEETYMTRQLAAVALVWERLDKPAERLAGVIHASALLQVVARDATVATQREVVQLAGDPEMQQVRKLRRELQATVVAEVRRGSRLGRSVTWIPSSQSCRCSARSSGCGHGSAPTALGGRSRSAARSSMSCSAGFWSTGRASPF